jgi:hypothetical protein
MVTPTANGLMHVPTTLFIFTTDELESVRQSRATMETLPSVMEDLKDDQNIEYREAINEAIFRDSKYVGLIDVRKDTIKLGEIRIQELADKITAQAVALRDKKEAYEFAIKLLSQVRPLATPIVGIIMSATGGVAGAILGLGAFFAATTGAKKTLEDQVSVITSESKDVKDLELTLPEDAQARNHKEGWYTKCEELQQSYKSGERKDLTNNHVKANSLVNLLMVLNQNDIKEAKLQKVCETAQQRIAELIALEKVLSNKVTELGPKRFIFALVPDMATSVGKVFTAFLPSGLPEKVDDTLKARGKRASSEPPADQEIKREEQATKKTKTENKDQKG